VNAISFLAILGALFVIPRIPPAAQPSHGLLHSVLEGGRYVRRSPVLLWIITIAGTGFMWAGPAGALLPALAGESLFNRVSWLSLLLSAFGAGSFAAAFFVMNVAKIRSLGTIFVVAAMVNGVFLILFALTTAPLVALAFAFVTGLGGTLMAGMGNNMLQTTTDDAYRGRVMSLWGLLFIGLMPVGQLALGALGSLFGIHAALAFGGIITFAAGAPADVARVETADATCCSCGARGHDRGAGSGHELQIAGRPCGCLPSAMSRLPRRLRRTSRR
jgi:hypothetical protein